MVMIRITTMCASKFRRIVTFFGGMALIQVYLSVAVSTKIVNLLESIRKANYFVLWVNSNQERLLLPLLILMGRTGILSIP